MTNKNDDDKSGGFIDSTSLAGARFNEQRALERLRTNKEGGSNSGKLTAEDLQLKRDEQRWEKVFNPELAEQPQETKLQSFKTVLKAKGKKPKPFLKKAKRAVSALSVPLLFGTAVATMIVTFIGQIESQAYASQAMDFMARGDNDTAYDCLRKSLIWNPYNVSSSLYSGRIDERRKEREEAYKHYERALKAEPNNPDLLDRKGSVAVKLNRFAEAVETYDRLLSNGGARKKPHQYGNRAIAYTRLGEYEKAIADHTSVLRMRRKDQNSLIGRAFCQSQLKQYNEAIADLDRLLTINPKHYEGVLLKGWCHQSLNQLEEAKLDFQTAIAIRPKSERGYIYLAHLLRQQNDNAGALAQLNSVLAVNPKFREAHVLKGQILLATSQHKGALDEFKAADTDSAELDENEYSLSDRAKAALGAGAYKQASVLYSKLIDLKPDQSDLLFNRALAEGGAGEYKAAIADIDKAVEIYPNYTQAILKRAEFNLKFGNEVTAVSDFHHAIASSPYDAKPYIEFGKFNLAKKQFVTAKECFEKAARFDPSNQSVKQLTLAASANLKKLAGSSVVVVDPNALTKKQLAEIDGLDFKTLVEKGYNAIKTRDLNYARAAMERAVRLDPNSKTARRYLATIYISQGAPVDADNQLATLRRMGGGQENDSLLLAKAYRTAGNCDRAAYYLEGYLANHPHDPYVTGELVDAYAALGNSEKAIDLCSQTMAKTKDKTAYASLNKRYVSLKESEARILKNSQDIKKESAQKKPFEDTQG